MNEPEVGLDSMCVSYLLDCIADICEPTDKLATEKIALVRSWFYKSDTFFLTETVIAEVSQIRKIDRRKIHEMFICAHFLDDPVRDHAAVKARAAYFEGKHRGSSDCMILAEAEDLELDVVLTYDIDFLELLSDASNTTKLMKPTAYWASLGIARGTSPVTRPHDTNRLSEQDWWKW